MFTLPYDQIILYAILFTIIGSIIVIIARRISGR
jgi:hypothetical protein